MDNQYVYTQRDLLKGKEKYQYSQYYGRSFLKTYYKQRQDFLDNLPLGTEITFDVSGNTFSFLENFIGHWADIDVVPDEGIALLLKKFEVTKRIYDRVDPNFNPKENALSDNPNLYALFSYCCYLAYKRTGHLSFLNGLIKSNDIITSQNQFHNINIKMLREVISKEISCVKELDE
ncbi:MAG: hypothetical protein LBI30_02740 [Holosporales bacterium]|jgi:hypothetical protein|nr:hypothetical protein [Holosporales bacterium]